MNGHQSALKNHIVIFGWSPRIEAVLARVTERAAFADRERPVLVIASKPDEALQSLGDRVYLVYGSLNDPQILERASIQTANMIVVPRDSGSDSPFILLAALSLNPSLKVYVELDDRRHLELLNVAQRAGRLAGNVQAISSDELADHLLVSTLMEGGTPAVFNILCSPGRGQSGLRSVQLPAGWSERSFRSFSEACAGKGIVAIGITSGSRTVLNPPEPDVPLRAGDTVWLLAPPERDLQELVR